MTEIVEQAPEGEPMSLDEISELVHEVRQKGKSPTYGEIPILSVNEFLAD